MNNLIFSEKLIYLSTINIFETTYFRGFSKSSILFNFGYKLVLAGELKKENEKGFIVKSSIWEPEVTAKISKKGIKIHEVPVSFNSSRTHKEGKKLRGKDGLMAIWTLFKYRFKD